MKNTDEVAILWDYENCPTPTNASGYRIVNNILSVAHMFGSVKLFKAYLEATEEVPVSRSLVLRSELQSSGVSLTDCPHNGRKDVADKMIIADMLAYAIDNPSSTIVLISGDRDFAYALAILRHRRYRIVLITLSNAHPSLRVQASRCFDWVSDVLEPIDPTLSHQPSPRQGKTSPHDKFYSHNSSKYSLQELYDEKSADDIEFMNYFHDATRSKTSRPSRGSPNLTENDAAGVPEPFESTMRIPPAESDLRGSDLTQQDAYDAEAPILWSFDEINDDDSDPAHSDIGPPSTPPSVSVPFWSLNNTTASSVSQRSAKAANPFQPGACPPPVPDKFQILVGCLKAHRLQGRVRLLRSQIALQIARNGTTYRQAGVLKFKEYIAMAVEAGIVEVGGSGLVAWIALREPWHNASL